MLLGTTLISCATIGEHIHSKLVDNGLLKTISNQDYATLKREGNFFVLGYFTILYKGLNITKNCGVGLNSSGGPGLVLEESGGIILATKEKRNTLYSITCGKRDSNPYINYSFEDVPLFIEGTASYIGEIKVDFTDMKIADPNKKYQNVGPWIKSISYNYDEHLKRNLEDTYKIKSDSNIKIGFK